MKNDTRVDRMTRDEFGPLIAQSAINIAEGLTTIEAGSPVHRALQDFCAYANETPDFDHQQWLTIRRALAVNYVKVTREIKRARKSGKLGALSSLAMEAADVKMVYDKVVAAFPPPKAA